MVCSCSALGQIDLSKLELYSWAKEAAEMEAIVAAQEGTEGAEPQPVDFDFQFPVWFQGTLASLTAFSELTQGTM